MGKSSKDKRDIYYRLAKEKGYRARSAFKLLQINEEFDIFSNVSKVVDLCAAPGSWSQVLSQELRYFSHRNFRSNSDLQIVAVDLQPMAPVEGVTQIQGDITKQSTLDEIFKMFGGEKADLVVCDGAPDVTGLHDLDEYMQSQLISSAYRFARAILKEGGNFVAKIFRSAEIVELYSQLSVSFANVFCFKPRSSRMSSMENFIVCLNYHNESLVSSLNDMSIMEKEEFPVIPFITCGNLDDFPDSDMTYSLGEDYIYLEPIQPPIRATT